MYAASNMYDMHRYSSPSDCVHASKLLVWLCVSRKAKNLINFFLFFFSPLHFPPFPATHVVFLQEWQCPMRSNSFSIPFMILMLFAYVMDGQFHHSHKFAQVCYIMLQLKLGIYTVLINEAKLMSSC